MINTFKNFIYSTISCWGGGSLSLSLHSSLMLSLFINFLWEGATYLNFDRSYWGRRTNFSSVLFRFMNFLWGVVVVLGLTKISSLVVVVWRWSDSDVDVNVVKFSVDVLLLITLLLSSLVLLLILFTTYLLLLLIIIVDDGVDTPLLCLLLIFFWIWACNCFLREGFIQTRSRRFLVTTADAVAFTELCVSLLWFCDVVACPPTDRDWKITNFICFFLQNNTTRNRA